MENGGWRRGAKVWGDEIGGSAGSLIDPLSIASIVFFLFRFLYEFTRATSALVGRRNLDNDRSS